MNEAINSGFAVGEYTRQSAEPAEASVVAGFSAARWLPAEVTDADAIRFGVGVMPTVGPEDPQGAVGQQLDAPLPFVDRVVVAAAQRHEVVSGGLSVGGDVVSAASNSSFAEGEYLGTM